MFKIQNLKQYDLEERTLEFAKRIIRLAKALPKNTINYELIKQLIRAGSSMGANYCEANETETKKDFKYRIRICRKEAQETKHWLRMMNMAVFEKKEESRKLWQEVQELTLIFGKIVSSLKK